MANEVYANGMELACKAGSGKTICAMPDVCFTPPENPATPPGVPVPYPNTGFASDTTEGSKTVMISGKEIMLKNKSYFKKSTGDEAGCAAKKGMLSSTNTGKVYFIKWSMDVKFEGENVDRHLDMTTDNHNSPNANEAVPWPYTDAMMTLGNFSECSDDAQKIKNDCKQTTDSEEGRKEQCPGLLSATVTEQRNLYDPIGDVTRTEQAATQATDDADGSKCVQAMRCFLRPYSREIRGKSGCCPGQTPHHIPPNNMVKHLPNHNHGSALCVCMEGASQHMGSHGRNHAALDHLASKKGVLDTNGQCSLRKYNEICAIAVAAQCGCKKECIEQQLNESPAFKNDLEEKVTHWQSNSKQLGDSKIFDAAYEAAKKVVKGKF
ncbi:PAAR-like domain-containing protein [Nitrosospira briensis]|uniref:PAAR-like domain-containing protein n=1 Tax=Nitrosospira briensis TaxID=35799 RepID=UPI0008E509EA|nr:PAAR-like domain-containing protein [Nitrosospira briensis]SFO11580.1 protein of unknown function [Nitrosospira briensis]